MKKYLSTAALAVLVAGAASAEETAPQSGLEFYGIVDVGVSYDTHGVPNSTVGNVGSFYTVQKASNKASWGLSQSGMGQSRLGLKGADDLGDGWTGLFKLETAINPTGGNLTDGLKSVIHNNGVAQANQTAGVDSSQSGQLFSRAAYVGISNDAYGTLTVGRQTTLNADAISTYDPIYNAYAFSLIGFSGTAAGSGSTEDARWDNSVKYLYAYGPARLGLQYQFGGTVTRNDVGYSADLGADYAGLSVDAIYTKKKDEVSAGSLSAQQVAATQALGFDPDNSFAATVSDNESYTIAARYSLGKLKVYGGYEYIRSTNPSSPLAPGFVDIGGYTGSVVNNAAFTKPREQSIAWTGARYQVTQALEVDGAYYYLHQNSYATGANAGCNDTRAGNCSGDEHVVSLVADYHFSKKFDSYAGVEYSQALNGLASGFYHNNNLSPTVGIRYTF